MHPSPSVPTWAEGGYGRPLGGCGAGLMVWASRQVGGASAGVPVTPLTKGLREIRDGPLEVLRGTFEASTLPATTVEAPGELLGDITPSWASAPVLALLATRCSEAPLTAVSWRRVSSRTGGSVAAAETAGPAGADAPAVLDADTEGDDDPTQPFVNVDGVDPSVSDPWRLSEPSAGAPVGAVLSEGSNSAPRGGHTPRGNPPQTRWGSPAQLNLGAPPSTNSTWSPQLGSTGRTLPPRWRFRAPRTQVTGAVPRRRTFTHPAGSKALVNRPPGMIRRGHHTARLGQGFTRTPRVILSPRVLSRAWLLQSRGDTYTWGPGWMYLGATGPDAPSRLALR